MNDNLKHLIDYARQELNDAERLRAIGAISDNAVFVRLFLVGKSLVGWDSDKPEDEAIEFIKKVNRDVMDIIEDTPTTQVS